MCGWYWVDIYQTHFPTLVGTLLDYIFHFLLQLDVIMWLSFGQLITGGNSKHFFCLNPHGPMLFLSLILISVYRITGK